MIALALCLLVLLIGILLYNSLVRKRNRVDNASASVDAMLEKRFDLIPNLVACVRQYAAHEADTLSDVIERRSARTGALSDDEKASLDAAFGKARLNFLALGENYPELKASENFMHLQYTLNETEEQLSAARRTYNAAATEYNDAVQTFPGSLLASRFGFAPRAMLAAAEERRRTPDVGGLFRGDDNAPNTTAR